MDITKKIYTELRNRLMRGYYQPGAKFPSESDLSNEFSVNKMTMNKIVSILAEQGWLIRGIRGAGTRVADPQALPQGTIAFCGKLNNYSYRILNGIIRQATRSRFQVLTELPEIDTWGVRLKMLRTAGVSGIITLSDIAMNVPEGMRVVRVDAEPSLPRIPDGIHFVTSADFEGGKKLMNEILMRGHREILIFSSERFAVSHDAWVPQRIRGFHESMQNAGIADFNERTFFALPDSLDDAVSFLKKYLQRYPETTLIAADSDHSAELLHSAAGQCGIDCPGKIALTGFGTCSALQIASVDQNAEQQGILAARYLIECIGGNVPDVPVCERVDARPVHTDLIPILSKR